MQWVDYITITAVRLVESAIGVLERVIIIVDTCIKWALEKSEWLYNLTGWVVGVARGLIKWATDLIANAWLYFKSTVGSLQNMWTVSQEVSQS